MSEQPNVPSTPRAGGGARSSFLIYVAAVLVAGSVAGFISLNFLADSLAALGIPDPGRLTTFGLPFFRGVAWVLMALAVGSFMTSAFYISPAVPENDNERLIDAPLTVDGHLASRTGAAAALGTSLVALLEVPLVMSDVSGTPFTETLNPDMLGIALDQVSTAQVWLITAIIGAVVGVGGIVSRRWAGQPVLFMLAVGMLVPLGMEGHSASGGDHDYGTNSLLWHLLFMSLWVGGLFGLIAHSRRLGPDMGMAVRRYSSVAMLAIVGMAISGVINAAIRLELSDWLTTRYGLIITTKAVLTVVLALFGYAHRAITIPRLAEKPRLFVRVAAIEVLVMAATIGVAITMGRTPPPPPRDPNLNAMQLRLGYELYDAPSLLGIWTHFRFDIMFGTIGLALALGYLWAVHRVHARGLSWSRSRTAWWLAGTLGMTITMSTGIGLYMPAMYSMHMLAHMVLSMVIPLFMVLGAPLTLLLEAYPSGEPGTPGVHDWVVALMHSKTLKVVTYPAFNVIQFLVLFYGMYMSFDFYQFAISEHAGHVLMNFVFLISGYMYFWEVTGPDYLPGRKPTPIRLVVLFISLPLHMYMGVYLMQLNAILGEEFYRSLSLPWAVDLLTDQRAGGGVAWGFGQFPLVIVFGKLFVDWLREDRSEAVRHDAKADLDDDADMAEYNRMLAELSKDGDTGRYRQL